MLFLRKEVPVCHTGQYRPLRALLIGRWSVYFNDSLNVLIVLLRRNMLNCCVTAGCVTGMMVLGPVCGLMLASLMLRLPQNIAADGTVAAM